MGKKERRNKIDYIFYMLGEWERERADENPIHISRGKFSTFPTQYYTHTHTIKNDFVLYNRLRIYTLTGRKREKRRCTWGWTEKGRNNNKNNNNNNVDSATTLGLENLCSLSLSSFRYCIESGQWACTHHPHIHNSFNPFTIHPPFHSLAFSLRRPHTLTFAAAPERKFLGKRPAREREREKVHKKGKRQQQP